MNISVVIPCFKVKKHILPLLLNIGPEVKKIFVIDDACPEKTGHFVSDNTQDKRIQVIFHKTNQGVGGAVLTGYQAAIDAGMDIIVKLDGDGQMDPKLIKRFVQPIIKGKADYTKGNRFFYLDSLKQMPRLRLIGNSVLSFITKFSTGYWHLFDPTNGYTAIHAKVAALLPYKKISRRYFFESDLLFRLNTLRALVVDVPMLAIYGDEKSNLKIKNIVFSFIGNHLKNFGRRIFYNYYLRDMSLASIELPLSLILLLFGIFFGSYHWRLSHVSQVLTPTGTVMLTAISLLSGMHLLLAFLNYDINNKPTIALHKILFEEL